MLLCAYFKAFAILVGWASKEVSLKEFDRVMDEIQNCLLGLIQLFKIVSLQAPTGLLSADTVRDRDPGLVGSVA